MGSFSERPSHPFLALLMSLGMVAVGWFATKEIVWKPVSSYLSALSWEEIPCTIQESRVERPAPPKRGINKSDGRATRVGVIFSYTIGGRKYNSSRYDFLGAYKTGERDEQEAFVARSPKGTRTLCWVNPENPREAVLKRDFSADYLVGSLFSLFILGGFTGVSWSLYHMFGGPAWSRARRQARRKASRHTESAQDAEPRKLKPRVSALRTLIGGSIVAAIWNGFVWLMWSDVIEGWQEGKLMIVLTLFTLLMSMVGLVLIWATIAPIVTQVLNPRLGLNPRLELTLSRSKLKPGQSVILQWKLHGNTERVRRLLITVESPDVPFLLDNSEGEELEEGVETEAAMEDEPEKDRPDFITIVDTDQPMLIAEGTARFEVPSDAEFLFDEAQEELSWTLRTRCEIPRWPDSVEEHTLTIKRG